ncbi:MAG: LuxR C-terminal-related transcriptional regulator, partial [bacterium]|nr:LuxR C-terminal-related transcriptional regulator [bacterium]
GEELQFLKFELYSSFGIALIYEGKAMSEEALQLYVRSYEIAQKLENSLHQINVLRRIGGIHRNEDRLDSAMNYFRMAMDLAVSLDIPDKTVKLRTYIGVGLIHIDRAEYQESLKYYKQARKLAQDAESNSDLYYTDQAMSYIYQQMHGERPNPIYLDSAIYYCESMLKYEQEIVQQPYLISQTYQTIAYLEETKGNYKEALKTWPKILQWRDSALTANSIRDIRELNEKYETEKKEQQIALQQEKLEKESAVRNGLIAGSLLLIVIAGLVINRQKLNIRNKAKEKELTELKLEKTKDELTLREQELLTYAITISQKNNLLHNVKEVAKKSDDLSDANSRLKKINVEIENGYSLSEQWEEFRQRFEKIHVQFFDKLAELATDLTNTDRRICAYLKLGLSSKQIANLQNVSVESVEVRRSQIRKKLQLSKEDNLSSFIMGIK